MTKDELIENTIWWFNEALEKEIDSYAKSFNDGWLVKQLKEAFSDGKDEAEIVIEDYEDEPIYKWINTDDLVEWLETDEEIADAIDQALDQALGEDRPNAVVKFVDGPELKLNIKLIK